MSERNDGGPAFARPYGEYKEVGAGRYSGPQQGMSLHDYHMAKAMQGMLANPNWDREQQGDPKRLARSARLYADAMLAERKF